MREEEEPPASIRNELLERLRALEGSQSSGSLADLAYKRAREAMERALEESRVIRLQAIEDARNTREHELTSLMETMRSLRESAEAQISDLLRSAEIEATRIADQSRIEAQRILDVASEEAARSREEASAMRRAAEERLRDVDSLEAEFNRIAQEIAVRLGITDAPSTGWWKKLGGGDKR
jgi:hypothetical protein